MTLKPGTRCKCESHLCNPGRDGHPRMGCCREANRIVIIWDGAQPRQQHEYEIALCAACAEFHERDNLPCKTCGRADAPLHTTGNCGHCGPNAEYYERDKAERETASAIHAIHGMPGEPEPEGDQ